MPLSANFTIMSVLDLHQIIDLFFIMDYISLHLCMSAIFIYWFIFDWMPDIVNFALLSDIYIFCFPINTHKLYSVSQPNYLKTIWVFQISVRFFKWTVTVFRLLLFFYWGKVPLSTSLKVNYENLSVWLVVQSTIHDPVYAPRTVSLNPCGCFFSQL